MTCLRSHNHGSLKARIPMCSLSPPLAQRTLEVSGCAENKYSEAHRLFEQVLSDEPL